MVFHIGGFWFWGKNPEGTFWGVPVDASKASLLCFNSKKKKKKVDGKNLAGLDLRIAAILLPYITLQTATLSILHIVSDEL